MPPRAVLRPSKLAFCAGDNSISRCRARTACIILEAVVTLKVIVRACNSRKVRSLVSKRARYRAVVPSRCTAEYITVATAMRRSFSTLYIMNLRRRACTNLSVKREKREREREQSAVHAVKIPPATLSRTLVHRVAICPLTAHAVSLIQVYWMTLSWYYWQSFGFFSKNFWYVSQN